MANRKGRYLVPGATDPAPVEMMHPASGNWLCTDCGVRIWMSDAHIHDAWHERIAQGLEHDADD